jgi:4-amino-4-deoxychorismate lyase
MKSLKLIEAPPGFDYRYKYADRTGLEELFAQRGEADDILIIRNGWMTDTSVANIAFSKNGTWYSPSAPILAGTTWKRLVSSGILCICPIHWTQISYYDTFKLFNSMNDWDMGTPLPIHNIITMTA